MPAHIQVVAESGRICANKRVRVLLLSEGRANVPKRGLLRLFSDYAINPVAAILVFARFGKVDCTTPVCLGWFLYDFTNAAIVFVPEWKTKSLIHGPRGDALPEAVHAKVDLR